MEQSHVSERQDQSILIIDSMSLRRAQVAAFLKSWAGNSQLSIVETAAMSEIMQDVTRCRIAILNVGGTDLDDPDCHAHVTQLHAHLPGVPLVVLSERDDVQDVVAAFKAGARGFIPSATEPAVALQALTFILGGGSFYPPSAILEWFRSRNGAAKEEVGREPAEEPLRQEQSRMLTGRQLEVHELLRQGKSNKMIARELNMQESTVKVHVRHIMRKLRAANRTQAALSLPPGNQAPPSANGGGTKVPEGDTDRPGGGRLASPSNGTFGMALPAGSLVRT